MQILVGIVNAILDDPFDVNNFQVAGQHQGFVAVDRRLVIGRSFPRRQCTKSKLLLHHTLGGNEIPPVNPQRKLIVQSGGLNGNHFTESLDHRHPVRFHRVNTGIPCNHYQ